MYEKTCEECLLPLSDCKEYGDCTEAEQKGESK